MGPDRGQPAGGTGAQGEACLSEVGRGWGALLGADQGADRRAGVPGLGVPHCCEWEPRPRAENRLFLEGGHGCSMVLIVGEEPALRSSQASASITEARPGVQMKVPEARYSQTLHVCMHTCVRAHTHVLGTEACSLAKRSQAQVCLDFQNVPHTPGPCAPGS